MRTLPEIARDVLNDPTLKGNARTWSTPYLNALLFCYPGVTQYGCDRVDSIIAYALANLTYWRGDKAKSIKTELKGHLA